VSGGTRQALMIAALPLLALGVGALLLSKRPLLAFAALAVPISQHTLNAPLAGSLWFSDLLVLLALAAWITTRMLRGAEAPRWPRTPVVGVPFVLFASAVLVATIRGHELNGQSYVGSPTRLIAYAAIAGAIAGLTARQTYRAVVVVMYVGTVWMFLNALYHLATGTSQTASDDLSTGGMRILSAGVASHMALALVLALLALRLDTSARRRALHATIAFLAGICVILAYTRAVFVPLAIVLPILFLMGRVRRPFVSLLPLAAPFLVLLAFVVPQVAPGLGTNFVNRVTASPSTDANYQWRQRISGAIWDQVHESPVIGVGFGRNPEVTFVITGSRGLAHERRDTKGQEGHNGFLWLLAAGGIVTLGSFLLLLAAFFVDCWQRYRRAVDDVERTLLLFCALGLVVLLVPALAGSVLGNPSELLSIWVVLLLPSVVRRREPSESVAPA
jgi:O-antigen ligase